MNKVKEKPNRLPEWKTYIIIALAIVVFSVWFLLSFCNYVDSNAKPIWLYFAILFLVIVAIYIFCLPSIDKENSIKWLMIVIIIIVELSILDAYNHKCLIGGKNPITLEYLVGFLLTMTTIYLFWRRAKNQEEQIAIQIKKETNDRFTTAVNLLGSSEASARTGAIYSLYQQAVDYEKYRKQIVQILCSHIRSKTQEEKYQKDHKERPSNEIQTTIDLLFRETENKGLYPQFRQELPKANLSHAYCVGADFSGAHCQGASFFRADCRGADFEEANCQEAEFIQADCREADFEEANCQDAKFIQTDCQGANFSKAHCEGADFWASHCEGANFDAAYCQGANFREAYCAETDFRVAHCEGANFWESHCEGADFGRSSCQGASFMDAHCQGANFEKADCEGVNFAGARCQGASFEGTYCQEAHSSSLFLFLEDRIEENTGLQVVLEGALSQQSIDAIEKAKPYCSSNWYAEMQKIIEKNKDKEEKCGPPDGITFDRLEYEELLND